MFSSDEMDELKSEMTKIITTSTDKQEAAKKAIFSTKKQIEKLSNTTNYFLDSASDISFFYEEDALDDEGNVTLPITEALNKVGHAMHDLNPVFENFCYQNRLKELATGVF